MGSNNDISLKALAKINLGLDVVRRREDGYHEVRMIMQTIHLYDRLDIKRTKEPGIQIQTNLSFLPVNENNLIYKAAKLLMDEFSITDGVSVKLDKRIPVAAGMAGGSTDAAAMLIGVNRLFSLGLTKRELMESGKLTDGCSGHADSKEGGAYDRIFPAGTFAAYIYSGNQSVLIIEK